MAARSRDRPGQLTRHKLEILSKLGDASPPVRNRNRPRIRLAYQLTPAARAGRTTRHRRGVRGHRHRRDAPARCRPGADVDWLPRQADSRPSVRRVGGCGSRTTVVVSSIPTPGHRCPAAYVAGWIKRGPTGFIGTNKSCSLQTVQALVADYNAGRLTDPVAEPDGAGRAGARTAARRRRRPPAGAPSTPPRSRAAATTDGRATSSPMSPTCSPRRPPRQPAPPLRRRLLARLLG